MKKIDLAKQTALKAGRLAAAKFDDLHPLHSINAEGIHLEIDFQVEQLIKDEIGQVFPDHGFLGEENGDTNQKHKYKWIVDPIDGTSNYYFHNPYFAISIALAEVDEIILGVVYQPMLDKLFWGEKGKGAFIADQPMQYQPDQINKIVMGGRTNDFRMKAIREYAISADDFYNKMEMGSAALEVVNVAQGHLAAYLVKGIRIWDVAAANLILQEMGGKVVGFDGRPWDGKSEEMIAAMDDKIIDSLLKKINS